MAGTFSGYTNLTYTLTTNPTTITSTGAIDVNSTIASIGILGTAGVSWTIKNLGTVEATSGTTGTGVELLSGGSVTNGASGSTAGLVIGNLDGVFVNGAAGTVTNYGTISATRSLPTTFFGAGVILLKGGSVKNLGTISATGTMEAGVNLQGGGSVTNGQSGATTGLIIGYGTGVFVAGGAGTIANFGSISATGTAGTAVNLQSGGSVTNGQDGSTAGLITGKQNGVFVTGGAGTVNNFGTISATGSAINLQAGGVVANGTAGLIAGVGGANPGGVNVTGAAGTVTNLGTIIGAGTFNNGIFLHAGGSVTNGATNLTTALIDGLWVGVDFQTLVGTLTNFGTIESTATFTQPGSLVGASGTLNASAVVLTDGGTVTNGSTANTTALITAADGLAISIGGTVGGTIVNYGTISQTGVAGSIGIALHTGSVTNYGVIENISTAHSAVNIGAGGTVTNAAGATITANRNAITFNDILATTPNFGTVLNSGTIQSTGVGDGVYFGQGGVLTNQVTGVVINQASGVIESVADHAIYIGGSNPGTVNNFGLIEDASTAHAAISIAAGGIVTNAAGATIASGRGGINFNDTAGTTISFGTVVNSGTIQSTGITAGAGVYFRQGGILTNHAGGLITAYRYGISCQNTAGTVDNLGTIQSTAPTSFTAGTGIDLRSGGLITNAAGASISALRSAISIGNTAATSAAAIVSNAGTITGSKGVSVGLADTGNNTIINSGRIIGTGGTAVQFGAGNDTLIVKPGAVFTGAVSGGGGTNTIIQGASGTLKVTGFSAFETIRLANGGADSLTLTGANFAGVGGHVITVNDGNSGNTVTASTLPAADAIIVHAGTGADTLKGGAGNDIFYAGGKTTMTGGAGKNQFTFAHIGTNTITDFSKSATNEIAFSNSGFKLGLSGATSTPHALPSSLIGSLTTGTFSNTKQRFAYKHSTGQLFFDSGGSGGTAHLVATLTGDPTLSAARLFFVT